MEHTFIGAQVSSLHHRDVAEQPRVSSQSMSNGGRTWLSEADDVEGMLEQEQVRIVKLYGAVDVVESQAKTVHELGSESRTLNESSVFWKKAWASRCH